MAMPSAFSSPPRGVPLGARITGSDRADGGLTPDDAVTLGKALKDVGLDYIDVSSGGATAEIRTLTSPGYNAPIAERLRREIGIVVRTVGMITTAKQAEAIVAEGNADMVALARAFLDNPHWAWHAAQALSAEVARPAQYLRSAPKLRSGAVLRGWEETRHSLARLTGSGDIVVNPGLKSDRDARRHPAALQ
jgi:2,4-dienoyl-CoA reductase-like NADH-dependent reductase (Old Yellow Enzyme family)